MTPERWREVKSVFQEALSRPAAARDEFLDDACGDDAELRVEVESLLGSLDGADGFLERTTRDDAPHSRICSSCGGRFPGREILCPVDGEPLADDPEALVGATLDGLYHVDAVLGAGGFGTVYRARHELLGDVVALKVLRRDLATNPTYVSRFLREGRAARAIDHDNVVRIHDLRATGGLVYLVMELVEGRTLRDELAERGTIDPATAIDLLAQMAEAIDAAHAHGVVHRDMKPENVMLTRDGDRTIVKVLDLGIARLAGDPSNDETETLLTMPGQRIGSPHYMSPEQWGADPRDGGPAVDPRADVYSLGVVAFEMLVGRPPFEGDSAWELRDAHLTAPRPLAHERAGSIPRAVSRAIARALAVRREDRFATASEMVDAMQATREERDDNPPRRRAAAAIALVAILALGGGTIASWTLRSGESPEPVPVSARPPVAYAAMTDAERLAFVGDAARRISAELAGREIEIPPDVRASIYREVERFAARAGTGVWGGASEDVAFVLERGRDAAPEIARAFRAEGLPEIVGLYLPMVESGYRSDVVSPSGARGMFQMIPSTAALYGVRPEELVDTATSARSAARFVRNRVDDYGDDRMRVALAIAAYNLGPRDVRRYLDEVVALDGTEAEQRFWAFASNTAFDSVENSETPLYIATFFAAAIVGENPDRFGLPGPPLSHQSRSR